MTALPPLFAALQDIIRAGEPAPRRLCPACRGTMESHSAYRDGTCMKCDDGYVAEAPAWDDEPKDGYLPANDPDEPTAEEIAELKAVQKKMWGF